MVDSQRQHELSGFDRQRQLPGLDGRQETRRPRQSLFTATGRGGTQPGIKHEMGDATRLQERPLLFQILTAIPRWPQSQYSVRETIEDVVDNVTVIGSSLQTQATTRLGASCGLPTCSMLRRASRTLAQRTS